MNKHYQHLIHIILLHLHAQLLYQQKIYLDFYQVFQVFVELYKVKEALEILYKRNDVVIDDIDLVVLHQASGPALEAFVQYGFPREKVVNNIAGYGNCIAASIPITLATANAESRLKRGDLVLMGGTGAGLSVAFALIRW